MNAFSRETDVEPGGSRELPAALEPELRRIIDTAVARVAAIELEAIREARRLTERSEQEARDALGFALDRAFNLVNSLELTAATVSGMAEALKTELDDAIEALRNVPEPESPLAKELAAGAPAAEEHVTPVAEEPAPRVRLTPLVRPVDSSEPEPAPEVESEPEPPPELAAVGAGAPAAKRKRKGVVRRFFTR